MRFLKGHGTENDFILLPDLAGLDPRAEVPALSADQVRRLCDRHAGIGADGVLRVLPVGVATDGEGLRTGRARWFMDYRNADGSVSEMCGNGARLFARYLLDTGLQTGTDFDLVTRGGVRRITVSAGGEVCVDMGPAGRGEESFARVGGEEFLGRAVSMTNPHLVCITDAPVADLDLSHAPVVDDSLFPDGVNVEFVNYLSDDSTAAGPAEDARRNPAVFPSEDARRTQAAGPADVVHVRMRAHERGVGETRSCGTGACAVAAQALAHLGRRSGQVLVDLPGGQVQVAVTPDTTVLRGPVAFVAEGEIDPAWWAAG